MSELTIDPMTEADFDDLCLLQATAHAPEFHERSAVWRDKILRAPSGCWIARRAGHVAGYLASHPWQLGAVPALDSPLGSIDRVDCWHIHDLAIQPRFRGQGIGTVLAAVAVDLVRENAMVYAALVAVQGSRPFWRRAGFRSFEVSEVGARDALKGYGEGAVYMVRRV